MNGKTAKPVPKMVKQMARAMKRGHYITLAANAGKTWAQEIAFGKKHERPNLKANKKV